jgi:transcriptional regulator with XRE-family HTH domain
VGDVITLGQRLREAREALGWSQNQLAQAASAARPEVSGLFKTSISRWERDELVPSALQLGAIASVLNWSPEEVQAAVGAAA